MGNSSQTLTDKFETKPNVKRIKLVLVDHVTDTVQGGDQFY